MKSVIVTGAAHGIGREIALTFARAGYSVLVTDRDAAGIAQTAQALTEVLGEGRVVARVDDLTSESAPEAIAQAARDAFGRIDCVVNNAADQTPGGTRDTATAIWDRVMAVNLRAPFLLARAVADDLASTGGSIVNMGSLVGNQPLPDRLAYSASKAGLAGLTRALATDLGASGVRVNAVAPGHIMTDGREVWLRTFTPRQQAIFPTSYPMDRVGTAQEVAQVVLFLASDAASFVTGATVPIDGGMSVLCPETAVFRAADID